MTVVVLAKTRMGQNICVGAADLETGEPLRLIPRQAAAYHSWREFEAEIGHVIEIEGERAPNVDPPHVEDFLVDNWRDFLAGRYRVDQTIPNPAEWISDHCEVWDVDVEDIFGGQLEATGTGSRFLPRSADIGQMRSVGFWRLPFAIYRREFPSNDPNSPPKIRFAAALRYGFVVSYVGFEPTAETLPARTLVRLSLSRWWAKEGEAEKCWLQLSGWYRV